MREAPASYVIYVTLLRIWGPILPALAYAKKRPVTKMLVSRGDNHYVAVAQFRTLGPCAGRRASAQQAFGLLGLQRSTPRRVHLACRAERRLPAGSRFET